MNQRSEFFQKQGALLQDIQFVIAECVTPKMGRIVKQHGYHVGPFCVGTGEEELDERLEISLSHPLASRRDVDVPAFQLSPLPYGKVILLLLSIGIPPQQVK